MAGTTPRLVGVVAMAILGVAGGYGVGVYTQPELGGPAGEAYPLVNTSVPAASPTPKKRTPVPNNSEPLDPDEITYKTKSFIAKEDLTSNITVQVPVGWNMSRPEEDEARYTDPLKERWIRIEAGTLIQTSPARLMGGRGQILRNLDPAADLAMLFERNGSATSKNGTELTISTMAYTYIPDELPFTRRRVLVRWIAFSPSRNSAVEISVAGLPQDKVALEAILDRATKTVRRSD